MNYEETRYTHNPNRKMVWEEINRYLEKKINFGDYVVELGSGYCDWINNIKASKRIAVDKFINPARFCDKKIDTIFGDFRNIKKLKDGSIDSFLLSNFLEHLSTKDVNICLSLIKRKLREKGILVVIQPNYSICYKNYFDDYTHQSIWSCESLKDFINSKGLKVIMIIPKFLPFSIKSKIPKNRLLIRFYLNSPIKPFAGQMLLVARKDK